MEFDLDLGDGHTLKFMRWAPDRDIPANAERYKGVPDIEKLGATIAHKKPDGSDCMGSICFDSPAARQLFKHDVFWQVQSWEPLTVSPSLLCHCGDHGFIRDGKWVRA